MYIHEQGCNYIPHPSFLFDFISRLLLFYTGRTLGLRIACSTTIRNPYLWVCRRFGNTERHHGIPRVRLMHDGSEQLEL